MQRRTLLRLFGVTALSGVAGIMIKDDYDKTCSQDGPRLFEQYWQAARKINEEDVKKADAIIVFTGEDERITRALELAQPHQKVFITSTFGMPVVGPESLLSYLCHHQYKPARLDQEKICINPENISIDFKALDTVENAINTVAWLKENPDIRRMILMTSRYHIPRSSLELEKAGIPDGVSLEVFPLMTSRNIQHTEEEKMGRQHFLYNKAGLSDGLMPSTLRVKRAINGVFPDLYPELSVP